MRLDLACFRGVGWAVRVPQVSSVEVCSEVSLRDLDSSCTVSQYRTGFPVFELEAWCTEFSEDLRIAEFDCFVELAMNPFP